MVDREREREREREIGAHTHTHTHRHTKDRYGGYNTALSLSLTHTQRTSRVETILLSYNITSTEPRTKRKKLLGFSV